MAVYLGSKKLNAIYDVSLSTSLDSYFNRTATSYHEQDLSGLAQLRDKAFYNQSSLRNVTFPASLKSIGNNAFDGCSKLSYVRFTSTEPPTLGTSPFPSGNTFSSIYVPSGSLETYQNAEGFSNYSSKIKEW